MKMLKYIFYLFILFLPVSILSQTDRTFWFVVPDITTGNCAGGTCPGGDPVYLHISSFNLPSMVTISMPAEPTFTPIVLNLQADTYYRQNMTPFLNLIENKPSNSVLNKGILIESTQLISVYYDEAEDYNTDVFVLKGGNALGTEFYTPFQNYWNNDTTTYVPKPFSVIDIVATRDNTLVTITPTAPVDGHAAGVSYVVNLNRGQTYSCRARYGAAGMHLGGTHIVSDKPVAVTISDDSVFAQGEGNCRDVIGDQLVPVNVIGREYIVMRGQLYDSNPGDDVHESVYILATQNNTNIYIDGNPVSIATINTGQTYRYELSLAKNGTHIRGSNPVYVLHVSGIGCKMGGAILPTVDDCAGSYEVNFTRPTTQGFFLNLMIRDGPQKFSFWLKYKDGTTFNLPGAWFQSIGTTGWAVLRDANKQFANGTGGGIPSGQVTKIYNDEDAFHVGMITGLTTSGCKYGYFSSYTVNRGLSEIADIHNDSIQTCYGDTLQLLALGGVSYFWDTNPPGGSWISYLSDRNIANPKVFLPPGLFKYIVSVSRPCLGDTTMTITVDIFNKIDALFSVDHSQGCAPLTVTITDESIGADASKYRWIFGDGSPDNLTDSPPPHVYNNFSDIIQNYELKLIAKNAENCPDSLIENILVSPFISANFTPNDTTSCNPLDVQFVNNTTGGTLDDAVYEWNFGDSGSSYDSIPFHVFQNNGATDTVYTVSLVAKSEFNCTDTLTRSFTINSYISAEYKVDTVIGCSPFTVDVAATTYPGINVYEWDYGDGSTAFGDNPTPYVYINASGSPDTLDLRLVVHNIAGCTDTLIRQIIVFSEVTADYTPDATSVCNPSSITFTDNSSIWAVNHNWNFGDGGSSSITNPVHQFVNPGANDTIYPVRLVVSTTNGCVDTLIQNITVHSYIDAEFIIDTVIGCSPFVVDVAAADHPGIATYEWDFGDGSPLVISSNPAAHIYTNATATPQVYNLRLVVDNVDCTDTLIRQVTVYPQVTAGFNVSAASGCHPLLVNFTNSSTVTAPATYNWDFGDGTTSTDVNPTHSFSNIGVLDINRTVRLIASSDYNCKDTITQNIDVYHNAKAKFTLDKTFSCPPLNINMGASPATLTNNSEGAIAWEWDFGDGGSSILETPAYTYDNLTGIAQVYNLQLIASTIHGCDDTTGLMVNIFPRVTANYTYASAGCSPFEVTFNNTSTNANVYSWNFDDGVTSSAINPSNRFVNSTSADAVFSVQLIAMSNYNCIDTVVKDVTVYPSPHVEFFLTPLSQVYYDPSADVQFQNKTNYLSIWNYQWDFDDGTSSTTAAEEFIHSYGHWGLPENYAYTVSLKAYNAYCSDSVTHEVFVVPPLPEVNILNEDKGCAPLIVNFSITTNYANSFYWDFNDGTSSVEMEPAHTFDKPGIYNVEIKAEGDGGITSDFVGIVVDRNPIVDFRFSPESYYYIGEDTLTCIDQSKYGATYIWDFGDSSPAAYGDSVTHVYNEEGDYKITLRVISAHECESSAEKGTVLVRGKGKLEMPNAFRPSSNNSLNTKFRPFKPEGVKEYHLYIYNRWGELLFTTDDPEDGWDGTYKGKLASQDVYIWKVEVKYTNGTSREFAGDVTLLR